MFQSNRIYVSCLLWLVGATACAQNVSGTLSPLSPAERKIRAALDQETSIEFIESPLKDICDYLSDFHNITIQIDNRALDAEGFGPDMPITGNLRRVSLRSALNLLLPQHGLAWAIRDEAVVITTAAAARANAKVQVYNVTDLLPVGGTSEDLVRALDSVFQCPSQQPDDAAPSVRIAAYQHLMLVRATEQQQYELQTLLEQIRTGIHGPTSAPQHAGTSVGGDASIAKPKHSAPVRSEDPFAPSKADPFGAGSAKKSAAKTADPFAK